MHVMKRVVYIMKGVVFGINKFRKIIRRTYRAGFLLFVLGSEKLHIL